MTKEELTKKETEEVQGGAEVQIDGKRFDELRAPAAATVLIDGAK